MQPQRKSRKARARREHRRKPTTPRTVEQFFAKPERSQGTWVRLTNVLSKMRSGKVSLQQASKESGISPRTVKRLGGSALKKSTSGRYAVKPSDQLLRVMKVPTPSGLREIGVRGSRQASLLGKYSAAVHKYLATGNSSGVEKFQGKTIKDATGMTIPLITDLTELNRLGSAGVLSFESIYPRNT